MVLGAAVSVAVPALRGVRVLPDQADVQQRLRTVLEVLRADVPASMAGAAPAWRPGFQDAWPAIRPCGWDRDPVTGLPGPCARQDVLSFVLRSRPLEVGTVADLASPADPLVVGRPSGCPAGATGCEFDVGDRAIVADGFGAAEAFEVVAVSAGGARIDHSALEAAYPSGSVLVAGRVRTYYAREDPTSGGLQLRRIEGGSDQPVVDHLSGFAVDYAGTADVPVLETGPGGLVGASFGPSPRLDASAPPGVVRYLPSCAFDIVDGLPVSTMLPLAPGPDGLAPLSLASLADGPWCPDPLAAGRFDLDLFRISRVRIVVWMQSPHAWHRGAIGAFFRRGGSSAEAGGLVPDVAAAVVLTRLGGPR